VGPISIPPPSSLLFRLQSVSAPCSQSLLVADFHLFILCCSCTDREQHDMDPKHD
jgi:hypothetical protein